MLRIYFSFESQTFLIKNSIGIINLEIILKVIQFCHSSHVFNSKLYQYLIHY
jgi:hypothetical protein